MNAFQNENDNALLRQSLLTSPPGERRDVEYKASVRFAPDSEFGLKLVKHILGMANIGGGWIVIGHEDGSLRPDRSLGGGDAAMLSLVPQHATLPEARKAQV